MQSFHAEVSHEIKNPKASGHHLNNLNRFVILQMEKQGAEVKFFVMKNTNVGATKINPLERLRAKEILTHEEFCAGTKYQRDFNLSNKSHHARPSSIFEGLAPCDNGKPYEGGPNEDQLEASAKIHNAKRAIMLFDTPKRFTNFKNFKDHKKFPQQQTKSKNLLKILEKVFEEEIAIENCQVILSSHRRTIEDRIKIICKILLTTTSV